MAAVVVGRLEISPSYSLLVTDGSGGLSPDFWASKQTSSCFRSDDTTGMLDFLQGPLAVVWCVYDKGCVTSTHSSLFLH